jgi:hypothetical protein
VKLLLASLSAVLAELLSIILLSIFLVPEQTSGKEMRFCAGSSFIYSAAGAGHVASSTNASKYLAKTLTFELPGIEPLRNRNFS